MARAPSAQWVMRRPFEIVRLPLLPRLVAHRAEIKPAWAARQIGGAAKRLHALVHQRLGVPAPAIARAFGREAQVTGADPFVIFTYENQFDGVLDAIEIAFIDVSLGAARCFYDIGANNGLYTYAALSHPSFDGAVHAFEPGAAVFADLKRALATFGQAERAHLHEFALSDRDATLRLSTPKASNFAAIGESGAPVAARRLDGLSLPDPDLIKIDVENHEAAVFRGGAEMIARAKPAILFEAVHGAANEAMEILRGHGYGFYRLAWVDESTRRLMPRPRMKPGDHLRIALIDAAETNAPADGLNLVAWHAEKTAQRDALFPPFDIA